MSPLLRRLYLANAAVLLVHQMDAAYWHEWVLFRMPRGLALYLALNVPIALAMLAGYGAVTAGRASAVMYAWVRDYESVDLLPAAARQEGGQRRYGPADVQRLLVIRRCREFGFSVEQVRDLVGLVEDEARRCTEARALAQAHLERVRAKLVELARPDPSPPPATPPRQPRQVRA